MRKAVAVAILLTAGSAAAEPLATGFDLARVQFGIGQPSAGGMTGSYDVLKVFSNPARLSYQPRTWEVAVANQLLFGGDENVWAAAGGWQSAPAGGLGYGAAVLASGMSMARIAELDVFGNPTGTEVSPGALRSQVSGMIRWQGVAFGLGLGMVTDSLDGLEGDGAGKTNLSAYLLDLGATVHWGRWDIGLAWRSGVGGDREVAPLGSALSVGPSFALTGPINGSIGAELVFPGDGVSGIQAAGGIEWHAHRWISLEAGVATSGGRDVSAAKGLQPRAGLVVRYANLNLGYLAGIPLDGGAGLTHSIGLRWSIGSERPSPSGRLFGAQAPAFQQEARANTLAVAGFEPQGVSASDAAVISDMLRNAIAQEGAFTIVEKSNMEVILREQTFQQTGCTSSECAVKLGKILNVRFLAVGSFGKVMDVFVVSMRVVDVETARVVYTDSVQGANIGEVREGLNQLARRLSAAVNR